MDHAFMPSKSGLDRCAYMLTATQAASMGWGRNASERPTERFRWQRRSAHAEPQEEPRCPICNKPVKDHGLATCERCRLP